jgi:glycosyltransferase involved in cell wall biosynthesis
MRIGFDAKRFFHNKTGLGNYSRSLINSLVELIPGNDYFLFDSNGRSENITPPAGTEIVHPTRRIPLWRQIGISNQIEKLKLDIYHGLSAELPISRPRGTKQVVSIHDIIFIKYSEYYKFFDRLIYTYKTRHAIYNADAVICASQVTKNDLMQIFSIDSEKVKVVYQSCAPEFNKSTSQEYIDQFKRENQLPSKFMLCVSKFEKRKNHIRLINAWRTLPTEQRLPLILIGQIGDTFEQVQSLVNQIEENDIMLLTDVQAESLPHFYQAAKWSIFPSEYEGFGIPVLESMSCNTPVLTSINSSMSEITGNHEGLFDPRDEVSIANAILRSMDEEFRLSLINRIEDRIEIFSQQNIANQHVEIYKSLL